MNATMEERAPGNGRPAEAPAPHAGGTSPLWDLARILFRRLKLIAVVTVVVAVLSVVVALLQPRYYGAEARVLQPEDSGLGALGGLIGAPAGLGGLLGGGGGDYTRYLTILTSRTLLEQVVEEFDLVAVYDLEESESATQEAVEILRTNTDFAIDDAFFFLAVRAYDRDPVRAAGMANFLVNALNVENARLSSESARQTRTFIERRLRQAESDLDSVRAELQAFQEQHGVVELEAQAQAFMQSMATLRAEVAQAEVRYEALLQQYGPDNPQVSAARSVLQAARTQVRSALGGEDAVLPVSMQELPALMRRYAELVQGQMVQARTIESVAPLYEQALFQERSETDAVQVVDEAVPPLLPARPSRRSIVVLGTLSGFMLVVVYVLLHAWWQRHYATVAARLRHEASRESVRTT